LKSKSRELNRGGAAGRPTSPSIQEREKGAVGKGMLGKSGKKYPRWQGKKRNPHESRGEGESHDKTRTASLSFKSGCWGCGGK